MNRIALCLCLLFVMHLAGGCSADGEPDLAALHETLPGFSGHQSQDFWFDVEDVDFTSDGEVSIEGFVHEHADDATRTCYILGMSPNDRHRSPIKEQVVELGTRSTLAYSFGFEQGQGQPEKGYYTLVLSCFGEDQHVFVNFKSTDWVAE
ncbi:MAG: hypothetical protein PF636_05885 [Actinomycetota bacterium]|jgi:hypothetical protein|nr:hypothetical protein [Actinomycetota bacterium]